MFCLPESIKHLQHLQWSIQDNKDRLASGQCPEPEQNLARPSLISEQNLNRTCVCPVSAALQQLAVLDSLSRAVDGLKCSLERIVSNSTDPQRDACPLSRLSWCLSVSVCPRLSSGSVTVLCVPGSGSVSDGCCPLGWETFGSSCYLFSRSVLSWHEARDWCNGHESHLVILMSDEEWDFVTRFSAGSFYWVGLTDEKSGRWEWVNQTPYVMNRRYDLELNAERSGGFSWMDQELDQRARRPSEGLMVTGGSSLAVMSVTHHIG
uniref:C-type lectin domain-containing protein n=1 Tax=Xiphophorus couchianus TaxID=32473 RepID=A0A3B5M7X9_9TELE